MASINEENGTKK